MTTSAASAPPASSRSLQTRASAPYPAILAYSPYVRPWCFAVLEPTWSVGRAQAMGALSRLPAPLPPLLKVYFGGFPVLANLAVGDGKFLPELKVFRVNDGFVVEGTEHQLAPIVAVMDANPHPFA